MENDMNDMDAMKLHLKWLDVMKKEIALKEKKCKIETQMKNCTSEESLSKLQAEYECVERELQSVQFALHIWRCRCGRE